MAPSTSPDSASTSVAACSCPEHGATADQRAQPGPGRAPGNHLPGRPLLHQEPRHRAASLRLQRDRLPLAPGGITVLESRDFGATWGSPRIVDQHRRRGEERWVTAHQPAARRIVCDQNDYQHCHESQPPGIYAWWSEDDRHLGPESRDRHTRHRAGPGARAGGRHPAGRLPLYVPRHPQEGRSGQRRRCDLAAAGDRGQRPGASLRGGRAAAAPLRPAGVHHAREQSPQLPVLPGPSSIGTARSRSRWTAHR